MTEDTRRAVDILDAQNLRRAAHAIESRQIVSKTTIIQRVLRDVADRIEKGEYPLK
jgi:hypothetical protein